MAYTNPNQTMVTKTNSNGRRTTEYIPKNQVSCQYYKTAVAGDYDIHGNIITQSDIDNGVVREIGFNCASPVVDWMRDTYNPNTFYNNSRAGQYYLNNPDENPIDDKNRNR